MSGTRRVGPVLLASEVGHAVAAAIVSGSPDAEVLSRGSYLRVLVPGRCRLPRHEVEALLGRPFELPGDLELVMPSFQGRLHIDADAAEWSW